MLYAVTIPVCDSLKPDIQFQSDCDGVKREFVGLPVLRHILITFDLSYYIYYWPVLSSKFELFVHSGLNPVQ